MSSPGGQMCRLVLFGPAQRTELAVPTHVPVADLLPALLDQLGPDLAETGLEHDGWVLQRLGEPPLDEEATLGDLGVHDGATLHLRARAVQIPPTAYDDLIDGVAVSLRDRPGAWRPELTRWAALGAGGCVLAAGALTVVSSGAAAGPRALTAGLLAVLCLLAGGLLARLGGGRSAGDRVAGVLLAVGAVGFAAACGSATLGGPAGAGLLAAVAAAVGALTVGRRTAGPTLAGFAVVGLVVAFGATVQRVAGLSGVGAAGVVAVLAGLLTALVPIAASWLGGVRLAPLPTTSEELQDDVEPEPSLPLRERALLADAYMTGLYAGLGAAAAAGVAVLSLAAGWARTPWRPSSGAPPHSAPAA